RNTLADSSRYAATLHGAPARTLRHSARESAVRPPSVPPHFCKKGSENRSLPAGPKQACKQWTLTNSLFLGKFFPDTPLEIPCFVAQGIRLKAIEFTR